MGDADELGVGEFHTGAGIAVVDDDIDAPLGQFGIERFSPGDGCVVLERNDRDDGLERRHRGRPDHAGVVVVGLDDGGDRPLDTDAVAAHHDRVLGAVGVEHRGPHRFGIFRAELEDVAGLDATDDLDRGAAHRACLTGADFAQIGPLVDRNVALDGDAGVVPVVLVGAGGETGAARERVIGDDPQALDPDRTERAGHRPEVLVSFFRRGRPEVDRAGGVLQLLEVELMVAAHERKRDLAIEHHHHGLDLVFGGCATVGLFQCLDRADTRCRETLEFGDVAVGHVGQGRRGPLDVGGVIAVGTDDDIVLAGGGGDHELGRAGTAHGAGTGVDRHGGQTHAVEHRDVGDVVLVERRIEAGLVEIERIGVLHREFAHSEQAALGSGLVTELGVHLVPDLRKRLVGGDFLGEVGEHLLLGHAECVLGSLAVGDAEHLVAHDLPAARLLPEGGGVHRGQLELLTADGIHLLTDDLGDLAKDPPAQRQHRVMAGVQLADEATPDQQSVTRGFGIGGSIAKRGGVEVRPAHGCERYRSAGRPGVEFGRKRDR